MVQRRRLRTRSGGWRWMWTRRLRRRLRPLDAGWVLTLLNWRRRKRRRGKRCALAVPVHRFLESPTSLADCVSRRLAYDGVSHHRKDPLNSVIS
jgi:hypothetical protein